MFNRKLLAAGLLSVGLVRLAATESPVAEALPEGKIEAKARVACTSCHDAGIVVQQRLTKALWAKEVDKMVKWGAILDPQDRDGLIEYLSTNFPSEKPPYVAPRSARKR